jgi:simple sugar transport system ATP-binding protein
MMVGREVLLRVVKEAARPQDTVLRVESLRVRDDRNLMALRGISLQVRAGEILGIAGVEGNGQSELVEAVVGLRPALSGAVWLNDQDITCRTVRARREAGVSCVPEDRYVCGVAMEGTLEENLIVSNYFKSPICTSKLGLLNLKTIGSYANEAIAKFGVRAVGKDVKASTLSGGNLQKLVLARELGAKPDLLVAAQPTRGLDIGSIEFVHQQIVNARDQGAAVLLVSAELEEVMSLSDRIAVLYEGQIVGAMDAAQATEEDLGLWMAGIVGQAHTQKEELHV